MSPFLLDSVEDEFIAVKKVAVDPVVWWLVMLPITPVEGLRLLNCKIGMLDGVDVIASVIDEVMVDVSVGVEWRLFLRQIPLTVSPPDAANSYQNKCA